MALSEAAKAARREMSRRRHEAMTEEQKAKKRAYHTQWQRDNRDKVEAYNERYWSKKAQELGITAEG